MNVLSQPRRQAALAAAGLGALWAGAFTIHLSHGGSPQLPLFSLIFLGLLLPVLALVATRRITRPRPSIDRPARALSIAALYVLLFAIAVLGVGFSAVREMIGDRRLQELALLAIKLVAMVAVPLILMNRAERRLAIQPRDGATMRRLFVCALVLGAIAASVATFATGAVPTIAALSLTPVQFAWGLGGALVWVVLNAALPEEVLFRVFLQNRVSAVLKSEAWTVAVVALVFAVAHVPGLYLRADQAGLVGEGQASLLGCVAYALCALAPAGVLFGVLWSRTGYLPLLVAAHALIDVAPNVPEFVTLWR